MQKRICQHCGKGHKLGHKVSHAKNRSRKVFKPNLHWQKIIINGIKKKLLLCTRCIRQLKKKSLPKSKAKVSSLQG